MTTTIDRPPSGTGAGTGSPTGDRFRAALVGAIESVGEVSADPTFGLTDAEIPELVRLAARASAVLGELQSRVVAEADDRNLAKQAGCTSTTAWLRSQLGVSGSAAGRMAGLAQGLAGRGAAHAGWLVPVRAAFAAGVLSAERARVIADALNLLSADVDPDRVTGAVAVLLEESSELTFDELRVAANRLVEVVDPDTADAKLAEQLAEQERRAAEQASVRFRRRGDGTTALSGRLPDLHADLLKTALEAIGSPRRRSARDGHTARPGGPHRWGAAHSTDCPHRDGHLVFGIAPTDTLIGCDCHQQPEDDTVEDGFAASPVLNPDGDHSRPIGYPTRLGQALMELVEHLPTERLPRSGGGSATVVLTMRLADLRDGLGTAVLDTGTEVSAGQARRLACNAMILPMVLGGDSAILDLGMGRRLFDRYQRIALANRDRGCVWRGCDRPPAWCEAHHLIPWSAGGPTDLADGALVCGFHHRLLHGGEWQARMAQDGVVEIIPPARIDPQRRPMRHERFTRTGSGPSGPAPPPERQPC